MRVKKSFLFAGAIAGAVVLFFGVNFAMHSGGEESGSAAASSSSRSQGASNMPPLVQVAMTAEASRPDRVIARGRTEAARTVVVRAETAGTVSATPVAEGSFVRRGQVLCRLDVDSRAATLAQAQAALRSEQLQYQASQRLADRGFRAQTQVAQDRAQLDQAQAQVAAAQVALEQVNVRAPFSGVFDNREAEIGAYLAPGQACGTVLELSPILLVGDISETEAARVRTGAPATGRFASGEAITGRVRFLSRQSDAQTRTYRVEVQAPNPGAAIRSGLSVEIAIQSGATPAHLVPVSSVVLDSQGRQGVRYVGAGDQVGFAPVRVLEETPEGVWVSGLSGPTRVITVGHSYVSEGQRVRIGAPNAPARAAAPAQARGA